MKLIAFLFIFFRILIDSCLAAAPCPVRAIFASIPGGDGNFGCVCRRNLYGDKCQFQAQNRSVLELNATWRNDDSAIVEWKSTYGRQFYLSVRRANYDAMGNVLFGKWRKAVLNFIVIRMETAPTELGWETGREDATETSVPDMDLEPMAGFTAQLGLIQKLSYQIRLVEVNSENNSNLTASVFLDAFEDLASDENNNLNKTKSEDKSCPWYACPARFFHIRVILNDFGTSCFIHGAIVAVPITVLVTLLIGILLYILIRQCKRKRQPKEINIDDPAVDSAEKLKTNTPSAAKFQETYDDSLIAVICPETTSPPKDKTVVEKKEEIKSVVIEIPQIVVTAPLSEADSQSESSADESSSDEGEYILP